MMNIIGSSEIAGTNAGYDWVSLNLNKFLKQEEVSANKLVLGIPFYTRLWEEDKDGNIEATIIFENEVEKYIPEYAEKKWDDLLKQYYVQYEKDGNIYKMWVEDEESIKEKLSLIEKFNLSGAAFWRKDFENESIWNIINEKLEIKK